LLVLGILRRCAMGIYYDWRRGRKNKRQSTLKDFHDDMEHHRWRDSSASTAAENEKPKVALSMHAKRLKPR
jgi:hypothetical protein